MVLTDHGNGAGGSIFLVIQLRNPGAHDCLLPWPYWPPVVVIDEDGVLQPTERGEPKPDFCGGRNSPCPGGPAYIVPFGAQAAFIVRWSNQCDDSVPRGYPAEQLPKQVISLLIPLPANGGSLLTEPIRYTRGCSLAKSPVFMGVDPIYPPKPPALSP